MLSADTKMCLRDGFPIAPKSKQRFQFRNSAGSLSFTVVPKHSFCFFAQFFFLLRNSAVTLRVVPNVSLWLSAELAVLANAFMCHSLPRKAQRERQTESTFIARALLLLLG